MSCVNIVNQIIAADYARVNKKKVAKETNIYKIKALRYIPENTIVKRVTSLPGIPSVPILQDKYMLVEVVKPVKFGEKRTLLEEVRRSNLSTKNIGSIKKDMLPVENGEMGFIYVGRQSKSYFSVKENSSVFAPNNPYVNMGLNKKGQLQNKKLSLSGKNEF